MKKLHELSVKMFFARQNAKAKAKSLMEKANEKGGVDQYIVMIVIILIVLVVGFLMYKWLGTGDQNVVFKWFKDNLGKLFGLDPGSPT